MFQISIFSSTENLNLTFSVIILRQHYWRLSCYQNIIDSLGRIGGDADLSPRGRKYGDNLAKQLGGPGCSPNSPKPRLVNVYLIARVSWKTIRKQMLLDLDIWTLPHDKHRSKYPRTTHSPERPQRDKRRNLRRLDVWGDPRAVPIRVRLARSGQIEIPISSWWIVFGKFGFSQRSHQQLIYENIQGFAPESRRRCTSAAAEHRRPCGFPPSSLKMHHGLLQGKQTRLTIIISSSICESKFIASRVLEEIPYINVPLHTLLVVKSFGYDFEIETVPLKGNTRLSILVLDIQLAFGIRTARASVLQHVEDPQHK